MNQLIVANDFDTMQRVSMALYKSGYFKDVQSEAQAIVKVMAGSELGLPPFASMTGIHIIQGKPVLGSNVIATLAADMITGSTWLGRRLVLLIGSKTVNELGTQLSPLTKPKPPV